MLTVERGFLRAYYLFDVADTIDLARIHSVAGEALERADVRLRPHASQAYLQFPVPPLVARLRDIELEGAVAAVRIKLFDYGVVSVRISFAIEGNWTSLVERAERLRRSTALLEYARATAMVLCDELGEALDDRHDPIMEDYLVVDIEGFDQPIDAETLLREHGAQLAQLLLGERSLLAPQEIEETLRRRFSYYADDVTIVQWDTAFIVDRRDSSDAIADILEFANSQLLELRTYDAQLDSELDAIYKMQPGRGARSLLGRREADQAATIRYLIVDILELLDRSTNALKVVGDAYYARIYRAAAERLGLVVWQSQIDTKLTSVRDMYRFLTDEARSRRDAFMEIIVIVLIASELIVGLVPLLHR